MPEQDSREQAFIAATENLQRERIRYAEEWQFNRMKANSDMHATQMTIESTKDGLTMAQALCRIAEWRLSNGKS